MGNHSKTEQRHADMARIGDDWRPSPSNVPRCACGKAATIEVNRRSGIRFYCADHRAEGEAAFRLPEYPSAEAVEPVKP